MADKKISQLPVGNIVPETLFPIVTSGITSQTTFAEIEAALSGSGVWVTGSGMNSVQTINSGNDASGSYSVAEGQETTASGNYGSHSEGYQTTASGGYGAHSEGQQTIASGDSSHAEGSNTQANAFSSHAEGSNTIASGNGSHAEGGNTEASGLYSHSEGANTIASGLFTHAEGNQSKALAYTSHAEGNNTTASGSSAHAEGQNTVAGGNTSHAEGDSTQALGQSSHAEGQQTLAQGNYSHAEGYNTQATGNFSHAEGDGAIASGEESHAEGSQTTASGFRGAHAEGNNTVASGSNGAHAEGLDTTASGNEGAHAEGNGTQAIGNSSHAEGNATQAIGNNSHAEGYNTIAQVFASHAEGQNTTANGFGGSHAEGDSTIANGVSSHAGGYQSQANGDYSFVHGNNSQANANNTIVLGQNITGDTANTTYVDSFNIKSLGSGVPVNSLGIDANGNVVGDSQNDLPSDLYIATLIDSSSLLYNSNDEFKYFDLQPYCQFTILNTNEIVRNGNDLFIAGNFTFDNTGQPFIARLSGCYLDSNGDFNFIESSFELISTAVHSLLFHNGFLFLTSRTTQTIVLKINPYDLLDIRTLTLPNDATYGGETTDILGYKDKLYVLVTTNFYQTSKFIEISDNLIQYRQVFNIPSGTGYNTGASSPFLIYNDELYIPFIVNATQVGIRVYNLQGNVLRERTNIAINSNLSGSSVAVPHWMGIFNNKLLITYTYGKSLLRLDCTTLATEESIALTTTITDDNTIDDKGFVFLNGEFNPYDTTSLPQLLKIKYSDFTNYEILLDGPSYNNEKGSYGSINNITFKNALLKNVAYEIGTGNIVIGKVGTTPVGNNIVTIADGSGTVMLLKDSTNLITAPNLTTSLINSDGTGKSLITKEYLATSSGNTFVTGGTYTAGTATFTNNRGNTFNVTGFTTGSTALTYWSAGTGSNAIVTKNAGNSATSQFAVAEGYQTTAQGSYSHAEGQSTQANGIASHAEGTQTRANGDASHAEGYNTTAGGFASHAEGSGTTASQEYSHAEGLDTQATGPTSHAEGNLSVAQGASSHAEGFSTSATGQYSHSQGAGTLAQGTNSHAGGVGSQAIGSTSFVHGDNSFANGDDSIVLGANITGNAANTTYVDRLSIKTAGPYANDAAADADTLLPSGGLYTITGSRAVFRKP